jgi:hypothetical protein
MHKTLEASGWNEEDNKDGERTEDEDGKEGSERSRRRTRWKRTGVHR